MLPRLESVQCIQVLLNKAPGTGKPKVVGSFNPSDLKEGDLKTPVEGYLASVEQHAQDIPGKPLYSYVMIPKWDATIEGMTDGAISLSGSNNKRDVSFTLNGIPVSVNADSDFGKIVGNYNDTLATIQAPAPSQGLPSTNPTAHVLGR